MFEAPWYCLTRIQSRHVIGTEIFFVAGRMLVHVLADVLLKLSLIVPRNSGNRANPGNDIP